MIRLASLAAATVALLSQPAFAQWQTHTILATPTTPLFGVRQPTFEIVYIDRNLNGLFELNELNRFSATTYSSGQGSTLIGGTLTGLTAVPDLPGISSFSSAPLGGMCPPTPGTWCFNANFYNFQSQVLEASYYRIQADSYTYVVDAPVPEPATLALMLVGLGTVAWTARRRGEARVASTA